MQEHGKTRATRRSLLEHGTVPQRPVRRREILRHPARRQPRATPGRRRERLQDELIRHLNEDERMSSFDFALQLLDADRMTRWGLRRDPSFWVENASVEWKESQAPFHVVGTAHAAAQVGDGSRKSARPASSMSPNMPPPIAQPLGSINRARRAARIGQPQSAPAARPPPIRSWKNCRCTAPAPRSAAGQPGESCRAS